MRRASRLTSAPVVSLAALLVATAVVPAGADVFPGFSNSRSLGVKDSLYMVIRDNDAAPLSQSRIDTIRDAEVGMREFYAAGSGGKFDMQFTHILDVPMELDADGRRPSGWRNLAESYVLNIYGLNPASFDSNIFDVNATTSDEGQGWAGVYYGGNDFAIQANINTNWGKIVLDHELGHRVSADHARAYRSIDNADFTPYVWNDQAEQYEVYNSATHGHVATPYGMRRDEYGNPFDTMGNISDGAFRIREKLQDLSWLTNAQVPDLNVTGDGAYRLYAHNELEVAISSEGVYGVADTYDANSYYGLTFQRQAERFVPGSGDFETYTQTIDLEYRVNDDGNGRDGVQFFLDGALLDLDAEGGTTRGNRERELEVGLSIDDIDFGMSIWDAGDSGNGDFLSYSPPAPSDALSLRPEWFRFDVLTTGVDSIGSYIDLMITTEMALNGLVGDLNQDGFLNQFDVNAMVGGWLTDTTGMSIVDAYGVGDIDDSGLVDLGDWVLLRDAFVEAGLPGPFFRVAPEPHALVIAVVGLVGLGVGRRSAVDAPRAQAL